MSNLYILDNLLQMIERPENEDEQMCPKPEGGDGGGVDEGRHRREVLSLAGDVVKKVIGISLLLSPAALSGTGCARLTTIKTLNAQISEFEKLRDKGDQLYRYYKHYSDQKMFDESDKVWKEILELAKQILPILNVAMDVMQDGLRDGHIPEDYYSKNFEFLSETQVHLQGLLAEEKKKREEEERFREEYFRRRGYDGE